MREKLCEVRIELLLVHVTVAVEVHLKEHLAIEGMRVADRLEVPACFLFVDLLVAIHVDAFEGRKRRRGAQSSRSTAIPLCKWELDAG